MKSNTDYSNQRVGIFVDVQNLYHSAKNLYHGRVNYSELIKYLVGDRQLIRSMAYVVKSEGVDPHTTTRSLNEDGTGRRSSFSVGVEPGRPDGPRYVRQDEEHAVLSPEAAFFEALTKAGLELRVKDIQIYASGFKKADWDVGMAVDAIRMSSFLDVVILVTGDGDFLPLVDYLKWGVGRLVEVAAFKRSASAKLQEAADKFINIEEIPRVIIKK